ncbi:MAG: glycoside hydrolase family 2, partial [Alistipes sp.]|nr:glycoside hydrolase family 2 [Alistipes sp.]
MKKFHQLLIAICVLGLGACSSSEFERNFQTPPEDVQTAVYWYWISGNISKEGVIEDLHAMKRAGINRAFIGDIGQDGLYTERDVKIFSDEWWEVMHTALKTATELDIEIGIFNSPGWSQSGGPWVKPEEAMRYLASSQAIVTGAQKVNIKLEQPTKDFQHVRTIAYPAPQGMKQGVKMADMKVTLPKGVKSMAELKNNEPNEITLSLGGNAITARSFVIYPSHRPMLTTAHLQAKVDGEFKTVA